MDRGHRFAALVCGRRTKWLVLAFWLIVLGVLGPLAGKLSGAEKNDNSSWLPGGAESTAVINLESKFQAHDTAHPFTFNAGDVIQVYVTLPPGMTTPPSQVVATLGITRA